MATTRMPEKISSSSLRHSTEIHLTSSKRRAGGGYHYVPIVVLAWFNLIIEMMRPNYNGIRWSKTRFDLLQPPKRVDIYSTPSSTIRVVPGTSTFSITVMYSPDLSQIID